MPVAAKDITTRKERILRAAGKLLTTRSFSEMTMDDVARLAHVNKVTVYSHFKSKAVLLFEVVSRPITVHMASAEQLAAADCPPEVKLERFVTSHLKWRLDNPEVGAIDKRQMRSLPLRLRQDYLALRDRYEAILRSIVAETRATGRLRELDVKLSSMMIFGLINSIDRWFKPSGGLSPDEIAAAAWTFVWHALESRGAATSHDQADQQMQERA